MDLWTFKSSIGVFSDSGLTIDVFDELDVDARCACGLDVRPRQLQHQPGRCSALLHPDIRSRAITSTFKGILNPESWHQLIGGRRSGEER